LKSVWNFFASIRLTVFVLLTLAATSIVGTVIPQNQSPAEYLRAFGEFGYRLFTVLDIFDMYHSWWFQLLLILLSINITVCSLERLPGIWRYTFKKDRRVKRSLFQKRKNLAALSIDLPPDTLKEIVTAAFKKQFGTSKPEDAPDGFFLYGEKWRWTRLGVYVVHLSVLLLVLGGLVGSLFGFEGFVNIAEGEKTRVIRLRNSPDTRTLDFEIQCDDFNVSFYPSGQPKEYRSALTLLEEGKAVYKKEIIVNDPLRYNGINIFQSSYGELPPQPKATDLTAPDNAQLEITSTESGMVYSREAQLGDSLELPEGKGTLTLESYLPAATFRGQDIGPAFVARLTPNDAAAVEITLPIKFPNFDKMRGGDVVIAVMGHAEGRFRADTNEQKRYYTGLQITRDPGVWIVYSGFILMILGCFITFFMSHQQLYVEVTAVGKGRKSRLAVSGTANRNKLGMDAKVTRFAEYLAAKIAK
jgi:cytochrome c biogenesis protein